MCVIKKTVVVCSQVNTGVWSSAYTINNIPSLKLITTLCGLHTDTHTELHTWLKFVQELFVKLLWALFKAAAPLQGYSWKTKLKTRSIELFDFGKREN